MKTNKKYFLPRSSSSYALSQEAACIWRARRRWINTTTIRLAQILEMREISGNVYFTNYVHLKFYLRKIELSSEIGCSPSELSRLETNLQWIIEVLNMFFQLNHLTGKFDLSHIFVSTNISSLTNDSSLRLIHLPLQWDRIM